MLETSTLEAMMAAVLFRPAPVPQPSGVTPDVPVASAPRQAGVTPDVSVVSAPQQADTSSSVTPASVAGPSRVQPAMSAREADVAALAKAVAARSHSRDGSTSIEAPPVTPDPASEAMRVAAQAAQRLTPMRGKAAGVSRDATALSMSDVEAAVATMGQPDDATAPAVTPPVRPAETASTPLGLLEGMSGVEAVETVEVSTSTVKPDMRAAVSADGRDLADVGDRSARAVLVSNSSPMTDAGSTAPVSAARAGGIQSLPVAAQVAETVRAAVLRGDHEVRLLLNPRDLGRIDIRITEQNGVLQLRLDASRGSTRDLLAREMPVLQQALESRDLRVERIQVSHSGSASADGSGMAWQQGFGRQGQQREHDGSPAWSPVASLTQSGRTQQEARRAPRMIRRQGVLDRVA